MVTPTQYLSETTSQRLVLALFAVTVAYLIIRLVVSTLLEAWSGRDANRSVQPGPPLTAGPAVVGGTVEPAGDGAVRVELEQHGREWRSGRGRTLQHEWRETSRRGTARTFALRTAAGAMVDVEPGERWRLIADVGRITEWSGARRVRVAELHAGDTIVVAGALAQSDTLTPSEASASPYREVASPRHVLRPPPDGPMVLAIGSLGLHHWRRARSLALATLVMTVAALLVHGFILGSYYERVLKGRVVSAVVHDGRVARNHRRPTRYYILATTAEGCDLEDEVTGADFERLLAAHETVPFIFVDCSDSAQLGERPAVNGGAAFLAIVLTGLVVFLIEGTLWRSRPWYTPAPLVERGGGPLRLGL